MIDFCSMVIHVMETTPPHVKEEKISLRKEPVARYVGEIEPGRRGLVKDSGRKSAISQKHLRDVLV